MTISGSQNGQVTMTMAEAGYLVNVKSKDGLVQMSTSVMGSDFSLIPYSAASLEPSGWYEQQFLQRWNTAGDNVLKITASAPYTIEWNRLPTGTAVSPPQTFTGKGQKVPGPIKLNAGTATLTLSCPDAKNAGFVVELFNANTGESVEVVGNNIETGAIQNSYSATKTVNIAMAGDYYIEVDANGGASWEVTVSQ